MEEMIINGCKFGNEDERNYKFGSTQSFFDLTNLPKINSGNFEYNQNEFSKKYGFCLCTEYAPLGMYSNNIKKEIFEDERLELAKQRTELSDFSISGGGYLDKGALLVSNFFKDNILYEINKQIIPQIIDLGYYVNAGIYAGGDVNKADDDGVFTSDEIQNIKNANLGHSTLLKKDYRHDSYKGVKLHNQTKIEDIDKFINSWFVYQNAYIIIPNKVIKRYFENLLKDKNYKQAFDFYSKLSETLYKKEKLILQYVLQMKYLGKINNEELLDLKF